MSRRLRRHLPALAVTAVVLALAVGAGAIALSQTGAASAKAMKRTPRHAVRRAKPKPTLGVRAARVALRAVGVPYRWGGASLSGFDCSGLVYWTYHQLGITVPHNSYALYGAGRRVPRNHLKPGDVLVFSGLGHVGLYLGGGRMIHAPQTGELVQIVRLRGSRYGQRIVAARRFIAA